MPQDQTDIVPAVEQTVLAKRVDLEAECQRAVGRRHRLALEIDHQLETRKCRHFVEQPIDLGLAQTDREQSVLETVVEKDIGIAWRHHGAKPVVGQRPGRVFAR